MCDAREQKVLAVQVGREIRKYVKDSAQKEIKEILKTLDKNSLDPEAFGELMICASENNIKRIKEIIEESKRQMALRPPPMPHSHQQPGSMMPGYQSNPPNSGLSPVQINNDIIYRNNLERLAQLKDNYRTIPCKNFHGGQGCMRSMNCHFIHLPELKDQVIP